MIVGIFHPSLNCCGGAELVAIGMINSLKKAGHQTVVLTNEPIDQRKIAKVFGVKVLADKEIVFPFELFQTTSLNNIYTDSFRTLYLKRKCDLLVDTQSSGILPGVNITYIHHPILGRLEAGKMPKSKVTYFLPYHIYERTTARKSNRLIFSNSKYTAVATKKFVGVTPYLLYPPISNVFYANSEPRCCREDVVVSISRISPEKNLTLIPSIAALTNKRVHFLIVGMRQSEQELNKILMLIEKFKVSDRVKVLTDVSREQLIHLLRTVKVLLHLSPGEHFGMSIAEAMASGCIPIVHDSGGPAEFVPDDLRFKGIDDAARKIDLAILEWSPKYSEAVVNMAQAFSESSFSKKFLSMFNSYVEGGFCF